MKRFVRVLLSLTIVFSLQSCSQQVTKVQGLTKSGEPIEWTRIPDKDFPSARTKKGHWAVQDFIL